MIALLIIAAYLLAMAVTIWRNTTSVVHGDPHCQWSPDDTFVCDRCKRVCCYCAGGDDDELCDDCSVERGDVDP